MVLFDTIYLNYIHVLVFFEIANQGYHFFGFFCQANLETEVVVIR